MTLVAIYYAIATLTLIFHYTGHLERWGMSWILLALAVTVFPVVIYLQFILLRQATGDVAAYDPSIHQRFQSEKILLSSIHQSGIVVLW